ncbi:MAG: flippase-like domain-containing protein [Deltaproteobacteria bacterium]|nr:MAG: flippase-like domain-containing protein [Deltaproteobacteria bacterium]
MDSSQAQTIDQENPRKWTRFFLNIPGLIALTFLVIGITLHNGEGKKVVEAFRTMDPRWISLAFFFQLCTYICSACVWRWTMHHLDLRLSIRSMMKLGVKKLFVDQVIPTGGVGGTVLITRSLLKQNIPPAKATTGVLANFYSYYAAYTLAVMASLGILWTHSSMSSLVQKIAFFFLCIVCLILFTAWAVTRPTDNLWKRNLERFSIIKKLLAVLNTASPKQAVHPKILIPNIFFQMGVFIFDTATLTIILHALGYDAFLPMLFASFMMSYVVETLGPIPGGLGIFESSSVAMLTLAHIPISTALVATLILRGFTFWLPMIPGVILMRKDY